MPAQVAWDTTYKNMAEFANVPFAQFEARLKDHRKQVKDKKDSAGWIDWRNSEPRAILIEDLVGGILSLDDDEIPAQVAWDTTYKHLAEFANVPFEQFQARLKDHREQVEGDLGRAYQERNNYFHDRALFPRKLTNHRGEPIFDLHPAKMLLRSDVAEGKHKVMKPLLLWQSRVEYQQFRLEIFRHRIYQEVRRVKFNYWLNEQRKTKHNVMRCKVPHA